MRLTLLHHRQRLSTLASARWHSALQRLKSAPGAHLTAFLVLHELTAIVPLPIIAYALSSIDTTHLSWISPQSLDQASAAVSKKLHALGLDQLSPKTLFSCACAYVIVKALLPLRIAGSLYLTPFVARRVIEPIKSKLWP